MLKRLSDMTPDEHEKFLEWITEQEDDSPDIISTYENEQ